MTGRRRAAFAAARKAAGHTQESLASALHIDRTTVVRWEAGNYSPLPYLRPKLARLLGRSQEQLEALIGWGDRSFADRPVGDDVQLACEWLDLRAGWKSGSAKRKVIAQLATTDVPALRDRESVRGRLARRDMANALVAYYRDRIDNFGFSAARCDGAEYTTSILAQSEWLDLSCSLTPDSDLLRLDSTSIADDVPLDEVALRHAIRRLAEAEALDVRITNAPLYRLHDVEIGDSQVSGTLGLESFVQYALTTDLLEGELVDALASGAKLNRGALPLRDRYLADLATVLDTTHRPCAGGALALCAIARPADRYRGPADYLLLVQERAGRVLNSVGRLAVIPKAFHQPLVDYRADALIGSTLRRELEEELFGRDDVDNTVGGSRVADPMHPNRLSDPMRWLSEADERLRVECTGFGFNLVNGNYEFAALTVVEDERFWARFGDKIEANWESAGLRQYSSLDRQFINELAADEAWSNEGLFALLLGLRRLSQLDESRTNLPTVEWSIA